MTNRSPALLAAFFVALAWTLGGGATVAAASWQWPLSPRPEVLRGFEPPPAPWGPGHRGVDLAASPGQAVLSAGSGVVAYAGLLAGRGVVVVRHGDLRTTYEPVAASVRVGAQVAAGAALGTVQKGGHCRGRTCLHWGLKRGGDYLDPLSLLGLGPPRLLPLGSEPEPATAAASPTPSAVAAPGGGQRAGAWADALGPFAAPAAGAIAGAVVAGVLLRRALPPGPTPPPPRTPASPGAVIDLDEVRRRLRRSA